MKKLTKDKSFYSTIENFKRYVSYVCTYNLYKMVYQYKEMPKELENAQPADWVVDMQRFYNEHGYYRAGDLDKLLGDPCKGVTVLTNQEEARKIFEGALEERRY